MNLSNGCFDLKYSLYKTSTWRISIYYILCALTLGLVYVLRKSIERLRLALYEKVETIEEADFISYSQYDGKNVFKPLRKEVVRLVPYKQPRLVVFFNLCSQTCYYSEKKQEFRLLQDKFYNFIRKDARSLKSYSFGINEAKLGSLRRIYGDNQIRLKIRSMFYYIGMELISPVFLVNIIISAVFITGHYAVYGIAIFCLIFYTAGTIGYETYDSKCKLHEMTNISHDCEVVRVINGAMVAKTINVEELVIGDVVLIKSKDVLSCDMLLLKGSCLVSEAVLTGESEPILKSGVLNDDQQIDATKISDRNLLHNGSNCLINKTKENLAIVIRTGWNTAKGNLVGRIIHAKPHSLRLLSDLFKIYMFLVPFGFFIWALFFAKSYFESNLEFSHLAFNLAQFLSNLIPFEELFFITIGLEFANKKLVKKKILTMKIAKINEAGAVKYIGFDKTGTLTDISVRFTGLVTHESFVTRDHVPALDDIEDKETYKRLAEVMACCHELNIIGEAVLGDPIDEETFKATRFILHEEVNEEVGGVLKKIIPSHQFKEVFELPPDYTFSIVGSKPFSSYSKYMAVLVANNVDDRKSIMLKGAPEVLKSLCAKDSVPENFDDTLFELTEKGYRVIALARKDNADDIENITGLEFLGFALYKNPLKAATRRTINILQSINMGIFMITGDNLYTALNVGVNSHMISSDANLLIGEYSDKKGVIFMHYSVHDLKFNSRKVDFGETISKSELFTTRAMPFYLSQKPSEAKKMLELCKKSGLTYILLDGRVFEELFVKNDVSIEILKEFLLYIKIVARATRTQKAYVIQKYKELLESEGSNHCVAFVGDGANDCEALQVADVSLALGASEASLASDFNTEIQDIDPVLDLLREGRGSLETTMINFKMIKIGYFYQMLMIIFLLYYGLNESNVDYLIYDFLIIAGLMSFTNITDSSDKLTIHLPKVSFINSEIIISGIGHVVLAMLCVFAIYVVLVGEMTYKSIGDVVGQAKEVDVHDHFFIQNRVVISIVNVYTILFCLALNRGYPYKKPLSSNPLLILLSLLLIAIEVYKVSTFLLKSYYLDYFVVAYIRQPVSSHSFQIKTLVFLCCSGGIAYFYESIVSAYHLSSYISSVRKKEQRNNQYPRLNVSNEAKAELH